MIWHSSEVEDILSELEVDREHGLSNGEADARMQRYGRNKISNIDNPTFVRRFFSQLNNKYVYILVAVAIFTFIVTLIYGEKNFYSPLLIILIVMINALVSALSLYKSDNTLNALKNISDLEVEVIREGIVMHIPSDELVLGDIMLLKEGDYIAADARIIEENGFRCNESAITGELVPVDKQAQCTLEDITPVENRINMVFSGCSVVHGTAKTVVVETGLGTETGRTSSIIQQTGEDKLPMQNELDGAGKLINIVILVVCVLFFTIGLIQNFTVHPFASMTAKMLLDAVALSVAAIPEGLPAISTIVIALGIQRIIKENIVIKNTAALENLGKTTVICTDKTGILTRNKMSLSLIFDGDKITDVEKDGIDEKTSLVLSLAAACSTLRNDATEKTIEKACLNLNSKSSLDIEHMFPRMGVIPFDSERKTMTTINMVNGRPMAIVKGAPEIVVEKCIGCDREKILKLNEEFALRALRVICIAVKQLDEVPSEPTPDDIEQDLVFVGLLGIFDPPRPEAVSGIETCKSAGIRTIMITGDNIITAKAVAGSLGILKSDDMAITGAELNEMSDDELEKNIEKYSVFARVSPNDKLRILKAWQARGEVVTVTGDSVNDQEALATADIGCAIGTTGDDVAKGSADIIINGSSFGFVVDAIKESRGMLDTIKKCVLYLLGCNISELLIFLFGIILFGKSPLAALQLLWINLLTDCAPAISLSLDKAESAVMNTKNNSMTQRHIFDSDFFIDVSLHSVFMTVITLLAYLIGNSVGVELAMTMAFMTLGFAQIFHSFNVRTRKSVIRSLPVRNKFMLYSTIVTLFVILFLSFTPAGTAFGLIIPSFKYFVISVLLALAIVPFCEIIKLLKNKLKKIQKNA